MTLTRDDVASLCRFTLTTTRGEHHYVDHIRRDEDGWWIAVTMCGQEVLASGMDAPRYPLGLACDPACEPCIEAALDAPPLSPRVLAFRCHPSTHAGEVVMARALVEIDPCVLLRSAEALRNSRPGILNQHDANELLRYAAILEGKTERQKT